MLLRRPSGAELVTSRILTLDRPVDGDQVYPGRPGFDTDTNALNPTATGHPHGSSTSRNRARRSSSGYSCSWTPREELRVPGLDLRSTTVHLRTLSGHSTGASPKVVDHLALRSKDRSGYQEVRPVAYFRRRLRCHLKEALAGPKPLAHPQHVVAASPDRSRLFLTQALRKVRDRVLSDLAGLDSTTRARSAEVLVQDRVDRPDQVTKAALGSSTSPPGLGAPLFTRVTQDSQKFPGGVDYSTQPGFTGPVQTGAPGAPGVFVGPAGGSRPSFGGRAPYSGPRFGPGGSFSGVPVNQFDTEGPGDKRFGGPGQSSFAGGQAGNQGFPFGPGGAVGADVDGGSGADSSNEDGFAPNDPRRPFLFRNEDERPATPAGNRGNAPRGPFRRPAFGATHREDPFRPYKPPPLESGHQDPIFVPQSFSGPGSPATSFDGREPQRIDGFKSRQQTPGFGGPSSPDGFAGNYPYRNTYSSGGPQPPSGARDQFSGRPQQPFSPFANARPVPGVPTANIPNPRNHFANRFFDRTPAGTLGTPVGRPAGLSPPSLVSMEVIRYGPQGPQVQSFNGSALPGSLAPPENLQVGGPLKPTGFPGNPFLANRLLPRPPGNEEDYGGAFEGLIRDERPDLLELKPKQKPSGSAQSQPGGNVDFLEDLLPFYEKDLDIGKKPNEAANGGDRKPVIHEPIVPEHRDLLCDDDDPRFSGPGQLSPDGLVRRPGCIKKPKPEDGSSGEGTKPDGKNVEAPVDPDEEFLNYRNPFSGVLPSPDLGAAEKVDRDSKQFQRPFLDKDKKVIPVLVDQNRPVVVLDGAVGGNRNGLGPSTVVSDIPARSSPELGAGSPVEGKTRIRQQRCLSNKLRTVSRFLQWPVWSSRYRPSAGLRSSFWPAISRRKLLEVPQRSESRRK
ncbi:hypothetical protein MTO96_018673 [Rhipicephalus appendiculatus]